MNERIGFVGLGVMGLPMAKNLVSAGYDVAVHTRTVKPEVDDLCAQGAEWCDDLASVTRDRAVVITMLPDSPDVEEVMTAPDGVLASAASGTLIIDMSTIRPEVARSLAELAADSGCRMLDAPVSGGDKGAKDGTLSIMVGGHAEDFDAAREIFEVLGSVAEHVGGPGSGQTVKAANQIMVAGIIELVSEAILLLERADIDMTPALRVLRGGLAGSRVLEVKAETMLERSFHPGFRINLHQKDLDIALTNARTSGVALPVTALVAQLMHSVAYSGHGDLDHSALFKAVERLSASASNATDSSRE